MGDHDEHVRRKAWAEYNERMQQWQVFNAAVAQQHLSQPGRQQQPASMHPSAAPAAWSHSTMPPSFLPAATAVAMMKNTNVATNPTLTAVPMMYMPTVPPPPLPLMTPPTVATSPPQQQQQHHQRQQRHLHPPQSPEEQNVHHHQGYHHHEQPPPPPPPKEKDSNDEWPSSLRDWLERCLVAVANDESKCEVLQERLRQVVTDARDRGDVWTRNWDAEPVINVDEHNGAVGGESFIPLPAPDADAVPRLNNKQRRALRKQQREQALLDEAQHDNDDDGLEHETPPVKAPRLGTATTIRTSPPPSLAPPKLPTMTGKKKAHKAAAASSAFSEDPDQLEARAQRFADNNNSGSANSQNPMAISEYTAKERTMMEAERVGAALREAAERGEEIDLSQFVVKGTSDSLEKKYLRLTSAPDPATVRPETVLERSLVHVLHTLHRDGAVAYMWASEQFKSIRQDLSVQHIKNDLTVRTYEAHARAAISLGGPDFQEFNQCVTQLLDLYEEEGLGTPQTAHEFRAYAILYHVYARRKFIAPQSAAFLATVMAESLEEQHAQNVGCAVELGNWVQYFRLLDTAPNLGASLLRSPAMLDIVRGQALRTICASTGRSVSADVLVKQLRFPSSTCAEWEAFCEANHVTYMQGSPLRLMVDARATLAAHT